MSAPIDTTDPSSGARRGRRLARGDAVERRAQGADVLRGGAAAAADDIDQPRFGEFAQKGGGNMYGCRSPYGGVD